MDEELIQDFKELFEFDKEKQKNILNKLINENMINGEKIDISDDVYKDTTIDNWAKTLPILDGSKLLIEKLIKHPIKNKELLERRQKTIISYDVDIEILKNYENDILWIYKITEEITENNSIEILFPSSFILNYINYIESLLDLYHLYKIFLIPITSILYPLSTFLAPYMYLNKYMKLNITFSSYIKIIIEILKMLCKPSGNFRADIMKFISIIFYVGIYLYNMYQTYEVALFLYNTKQKLHSKMEGLVYFVNHSLNIVNNLPKNIIEPYFNIVCTYDNDIYLNNSMTSIYKIWKDDSLKDKLSSLLKTIYGIDVINSLNNLLLENNWSTVKYNEDETKFWNAKNPILNDTQIANPINLNKNIIVTGPNAGGITNSMKSKMIIYDTINSFMRVSDILGNRSYFEAEAEYCLNMINTAVKINKNNNRGLFLMDEPMHSTPPIEGMSTAYAVIEYLSKLSGITLIITTHFHKLIKLEDIYPERFINLSVDAIPMDNKYYFPYKINRGHSYLCIAIELLDIKDFPKDIIDNAIKMKNKICMDINK